ncbi:MAG: hemolysin family protein [archaeon]
MNELILLLIMLLLSAFFSGSETALTSLSDFKIRYLKEQGRSGSTTLANIRKNKHRLLITILIGNNTVNIAASAIATNLAIGTFKSSGIGIAIGLMTFLILVFGEITPKAFAQAHAATIALTIAPIYKWLLFFFFPLVKIFDVISFLVRKTLGSKTLPKITEEELSSMVEFGEEEGAIKTAERDMIQNIFKFDDIDVKEIMTPRTDLVSIPAGKQIKDAIRIFAKSGFSRLPVFKKSHDHIVGILYLKDVMQYIKGGRTGSKIDKAVKPAYFVPESMSMDELFRQFQKRQIQMAILVDEYGGIAGLVTLEDLLEEIVGEIFDETEKIDPDIRRVNQNTWLIKGIADLNDINKDIGLHISLDEEFDTISGYVLSLASAIPKIEDSFETEEATFVVMKVSKNRISLIKIVKKDR